MTTTRKPQRPMRPGVAEDELRLEALNGQARRPRLSWVALGVVVAMAAGLFGAVAMARVADRDPVLALARTIERGEALTADHLRVVRVASDESLPLTSADDRDAVIGLVAQGTLPAGTLVNREQFAAGPTLPEGWTVLGLALDPGQYPTATLAPGDHVVMVRTRGSSTVGSSDADPPGVLVEAAEVWAVEPLSETARSLMVSVAVPADLATAIANAAAADRIRLMLVIPR